MVTGKVYLLKRQLGVSRSSQGIGPYLKESWMSLRSRKRSEEVSFEKYMDYEDMCETLFLPFLMQFSSLKRNRLT
jgi:hypothetical protein